MENIGQRHLVVAVLLAITAAFTFLFGEAKETTSAGTFTERIPICIGPWVGRDLEVDTRTFEILETNDVLTREYRGPKDNTIFLGVAFSSENRRAIHPPEVCMSGGGWNLTEKKRIEIKNTTVFEAIKLTLEKGDTEQVVLYWYKVGRDFTADFYRQQLKFVKARLLGGDSSCALIRISTLTTGQEAEKALSSLIDFAKALMPYLTEGGISCKKNGKKGSA